MSPVSFASEETEHISRYFKNAPILNMVESMYSVKVIWCVIYDAFKSIFVNYVSNAVNAILYIHFNEKTGNILIFLSSNTDIELICKKIHEQRLMSINSDYGDILQLHRYPIYGKHQNIRILPSIAALDDKDGHRKVFITTDTACMPYMNRYEKYNGFPYVVDSGYMKRRSLNSVITLRVSHEMAKQRSNQAKIGGICYRLYGEKYDECKENELYEQQQTVGKDLIALIFSNIYTINDCNIFILFSIIRQNSQ